MWKCKKWPLIMFWRLNRREEIYRPEFQMCEKYAFRKAVTSNITVPHRAFSRCFFNFIDRLNSFRFYWRHWGTIFTGWVCKTELQWPSHIPQPCGELSHQYCFGFSSPNMAAPAGRRQGQGVRISTSLDDPSKENLTRGHDTDAEFALKAL